MKITHQNIIETHPQIHHTHRIKFSFNHEHLKTMVHDHNQKS